MEEKIPQIPEISILLQEKNYAQLRALLAGEQAADLAELFLTLPGEYVPVLFRLLPKGLAADVFVEMDTAAQKILITAFSDYELKQVLDELYLDDR